VLAHVQSSVRGQLRTFTVPVRYRLEGKGALEISGEFPLRQSELGLTPFSAMLGALLEGPGGTPLLLLEASE